METEVKRRPGRPRGRKPLNQVHLWLAPDVDTLVREQAASMGISVSQAISLALLAIYKGERHPILPQ